MSEVGPAYPALEVDVRVEVGRRQRRFVLEARLELDQGVLVLFGASGCGKSLTLSAVVGLVQPVAGRIAVRGSPMFDSRRDLWVPAHRRQIGYVPQHHSLFPFCNVRDNIAFGLPRAERRRRSERVERLIEELGLSHLAAAMPANLSGGERQRVALARALAVEPRLLVLDEPFASIDEAGRDELREALLRAIARHHTPALFVTHNPIEAVKLGDRVVRFERGRTAECGTPAELLPEAQRFVLSAAAAEREALGEGRARVRLREAVLDGPRSLLEPDELRLDLRAARPSSKERREP